MEDHDAYNYSSINQRKEKKRGTVLAMCYALHSFCKNTFLMIHKRKRFERENVRKREKKGQRL